MKLKIFGACVLTLGILAAQPPAQAQTVVWVSSAGNDSNTCTQALPCLTFPKAITQAGSGGEVDCLTPGTYNGTGVSITNPITINCPGGVLQSSTGITVDTSGSVTLRGFEIQGFNGGGGTATGLALSGGSLILDSVKIAGFQGAGLDVEVGGSVSVTNSQFTNNGTGIAIEEGSASPALVSLSHVTVESNSSFGVLVGGVAKSEVHLTDSVVANNLGDGVSAGGAAIQFITIQRTSIVMNSAAGVASNGAGFVLIGGSTVAWNNTGLFNNGGFIFSYRNNQINGNITDTSGTINPVGLN
jgi:hypothetical protein